VVNHPFMFPEADLNPHETGDSIVTSSAKMMVLDRILNKLKAQGRRALVYSQFTTMLDVIQDYCQVTLMQTMPPPHSPSSHLGWRSRGFLALTPFF
jgi:SNF2 family DNA or RNA helicase